MTFRLRDICRLSVKVVMSGGIASGLWSCETKKMTKFPQLNTVVSPKSSPIVTPLPSPSPTATPVLALPVPSTLPTPAFPSLVQPLSLQPVAARLHVKSVVRIDTSEIMGQVNRYHLNAAFLQGLPQSHFLVDETESLRIYYNQVTQTSSGRAVSFFERVVRSEQETLLPYQLAGSLVLLKDTFYGFQKSCIEKVIRTKGTKVVVAGDCEQSGYRDGASSQALFRDIFDLDVHSSGAIYVSEYVQERSGLRIRRIANDQISTIFESAPLGTSKLMQGSLGLHGSDLDCEGVCVPGSFTHIPPASERFLWANMGDTATPGRTSIIRFANAAETELIPIIQDGASGSATAWDFHDLEVDNQENIYLMNDLCQNAYLRQISPDGKIRSLLRLDILGQAKPMLLSQSLAYNSLGDTCEQFDFQGVLSSPYNLALDKQRGIIYLYSEWNHEKIYAYEIGSKNVFSISIDSSAWKKASVSGFAVGKSGHLYLRAGIDLYRLELAF